MPRASAAWRLSFRLIYSFLRLLDPVLRLWWHAFGIGITAELTVRAATAVANARFWLGSYFRLEPSA